MMVMVPLSPVLGAEIVKNSGDSDTRSLTMLKDTHCVNALFVKVSIVVS